MQTDKQPVVLIGGGTGLVGSRLSQILRDSGYTVWHLSRRSNPDAEFPAFAWDPAAGTIEETAVAGADYIINLAGAGIADQRWTQARKRLIIESRTHSTKLLLSTLQQLNRQPHAYISSAAIGIYGNTGDQIVTETDPPGSGFLAESCIAWEAAIDEVMAAGIRTVGLRIGVVLSTKGGALEKLLLPLNFGTAAYFGDGGMWYSWIHIDDVCRMFQFAMENEQLQGYYNAVAPEPVTNREFTRQIVDASGKRALTLPAPAVGLRLAMGEMADVILNSNRISSEKIATAGFSFRFPKLDEALRDILEKKI